MSRVLLGGFVGTLICTGLLLAEPEKGDPKEKPKSKGTQAEKIDAKVDRTLTGRVEKIEAKDKNNGTLKMRTTGTAKSKLYQYTFRIDKKTRILTSKGKPLEDGLKSRLLADADVVVEFVDQKPGSDKPAPAGMHFARKIQLIHPNK